MRHSYACSGQIFVIRHAAFSHASQREQPPHCHAEGQLFLLHRGSASLLGETGHWFMRTGRRCWIPPGYTHAAGAGGPVAGISLFLPATLCRGLPAKPRVCAPDPLLVATIEKAVSLCAGLAGGDLRHEEEARLERLLPVLVDEISAAAEEKLHLPLPGEGRLRRMAQELAARPEDDRDLDAWATAFALSRRTLIRRFRQETGLSFIEWRQRARIIHAITLLEAGQPVTAVSLAVGYESPSAFSKIFRDLTGQSPQHFARQGKAIGNRS